MQMHSRLTQMSALALGIAGVLAFGQASASGFQIRENSAKNLGRALAGSAVAQNDASVVSNNPAAMVNLKQTTLQGDLHAIDLTADFRGGGQAAAGSPLASPLRGGDGGDPGDVEAVPAFAVVVPLSGSFDYVTLGASLSAPFGLTTKYDRNWIGRYNAVESKLRTIDLTLSAAIELSDRFSVGAGLIYERADATLSNAVDFGSAICRVNVALCVTPSPAAAPFGPQKNDGFAKVEGDDYGIGWVLGFQWRPTDQFWVGYSHRSEIKHELEGTVKFTKPGNVDALFQGAGITQYNSGPGGAVLTTPSVDTLSLQYDFTEQFRLMADIQATGWSSLESIDIKRANGTLVTSEAFKWDNTMMYSLGGEYDLNDSFTLRAGVARDETPTHNDTRTPRLPDDNRMLYALGFTWNASENLSLDASYMYVKIDDPKISAVSSSGSLLQGEYKGKAQVLGLSAQYRF
ncbi:OmpP1/FadL family transporter [Luteimonas aquatica]|uniref:OmpP1/FadL family transporter n=1 Tax=Luteimonas aquatica TaxID=450364 RepID=UPI001F5ADF7F|nr:porin [Luteimonas aquatica]